MVLIASSTSLYFNFLRGRDTVSSHMNRVSRNAQRMAGNLRQQSRLIGLAIGAIVAIILGAIGQIVAFTDAVWPLVGALAAVPAMAVAAAAGLATLILGFHGLLAAMKRSTGGGGDLAAQEHRIAVAQRNAAAAQEDLNEARRRAADLIADTARALNRARLDEEGAVLAVADAQRELRDARISGDRSAIAHASLNYREAAQSLEEVRDRLKDVTEEEAKRRKAGVEGSDEVTSALARQADAAYELAQAQKGSGGADAAAAAYAKLSAAGKALVDVLHSLAPAWGAVARSVQQAMLTGVAGDIKALSGAYLPVMRTHLVAIGAGWNNAFRGTAQTFAARDFVSDMDLSLGRVATMWQLVGKAYAPFWSGFRHLVVVGSEFLPRLGAWVLRLANRFDVWAKKVRDTGKAHDWIEKALKVGHELNQLLFALGGATGALFAAGAPPEDYLRKLAAGAAAMRDFWRTPEGHDKLAGFFATLRDIWSEAWKAFKQLLDTLSQLDLSGVVSGFTIINEILKYFGEHADLLNRILPVLIPLVVLYELSSFGAAMATRAWAVAIEAGKVAMWLFRASIIATRVAMLLMMHPLAPIRGLMWVTAGAIFRMRIALEAWKKAMIASVVWTRVVTAAQWLWNASLYGFPLVWIIVAIIAIVAVIVILWLKCAWFRNFWILMWHYILVAVAAVGHWFAHDFVDFFVGAWHIIQDKLTQLVALVLGIRQRIIDTTHGLWDGLVLSFKSAINTIIGIWNRFHLTLGGGTIAGVSIPSVTLETPDLPYLHSGGTVIRSGAAVLRDDETVSLLPRGAQVSPLARGGGVTTIRIELCGPSEMRRLIRKIVSDHGGGNVQVALGR